MLQLAIGAINGGKKQVRSLSLIALDHLLILNRLFWCVCVFDVSEKIGRQADRQTGRQIDGQTDKQTADIETDRKWASSFTCG